MKYSVDYLIDMCNVILAIINHNTFQHSMHWEEFALSLDIGNKHVFNPKFVQKVI